MQAGFAEIDITPPAGTKKIGWMQDITGEKILDPLYARAAVFSDQGNSIAFIALDLLSIRWSTVNEIRKQIAHKTDFPAANIMISATHNHAGPAVADVAPVKRDEGYISTLIEKCVEVFCKAEMKMEDAVIGLGTALLFDTAFNRRSIMKDGTVRSQTNSENKDFLTTEGPIDPELAVLTVKNTTGKELGLIINFACHPTQHGPDEYFSAGYPGLVCRKVKEAGHGIPLYINGAYGNIIDVNYWEFKNFTMEETAAKIFAGIEKAIREVEWQENTILDSISSTIESDYRDITEDEYKGRVIGAQRYRSDELYEAAIDRTIEKQRVGKQKIEIQTHRLGDIYFSGMPAEYFVEFQLRIKTELYPAKAFTAGGANGMIGYVPTRDAFNRGGYETTLGPPSRMSHETGDLIADEAIRQVKNSDKWHVTGGD
ncbi:MAG: neutral/alkaline non-lysosomal ceramidase N-terminal domain-containing protein [Planctomycetota bacterium]|jgi:hypothetical protein